MALDGNCDRLAPNVEGSETTDDSERLFDSTNFKAPQERGYMMPWGGATPEGGELYWLGEFDGQQQCVKETGREDIILPRRGYMVSESMCDHCRLSTFERFDSYEGTRRTLLAQFNYAVSSRDSSQRSPSHSGTSQLGAVIDRAAHPPPILHWDGRFDGKLHDWPDA
jgi:hypothetical protein